MRTILEADAVYNGVGLPLQHGAVCVANDSAIDFETNNFKAATVVAFGKLQNLKTQFPDAPVLRVGRAILPHPVNAHTHLDLSNVPFKALPYFRWIPEVIIAGRERRGLEAAKNGLAQSLGLVDPQSSGHAAIGDIVAIPEVMDFLLSQAETTGVAYWEVINPNPETAQETFETTVKLMHEWRKLERPNKMRLGLSPHTPFTVSAKLMKLLCDFASTEKIPLQIHVAEHESELELFQTGRGSLAESLARMGMPAPEIIWGRRPEPTLTPINYLEEIGALKAKPTLVHMVHTNENDVQLVAQAGCAVVTCPRSNKNLECGPFSWKLFAKYGIEVGLGTDSIASGETLNILDEAAAAQEIHAGLGLAQIVRWASKGAYKALGLKTPVIQRGDSFSQLTVWQ